MRFFSSIVVFCLLAFISCQTKNNYEKETAQLDSLKIVLQVKLSELKKAEANVNNYSFSKFEAYSRFLSNNLKDTVDKSQANALRNFISAGKTISDFTVLKPALIKETETAISQLQKLSGDLKENAVQQNAVQAYMDTEKTHAEKLVTVIEQDLKSLNISLINFKNAVPKTEELIKHINNGELPSIVAESGAE